MKCPKCDGKGMVDYPMYADDEHKWQYCVARMKKCDMCHGSGEVEMTNEEWFCGLPTEEKAEFLNLIIRVGPYENEPKDFWECVYGRGGDRGTKSIVEWLKQPHTVEE